MKTKLAAKTYCVLCVRLQRHWRFLSVGRSDCTARLIPRSLWQNGSCVSSVVVVLPLSLLVVVVVRNLPFSCLTYLLTHTRAQCASTTHFFGPPKCTMLCRYNGRRDCTSLLRPGRVAEYCDEHICLCVCPRTYPQNYTSRSYQCLCVTVGRGSVILWRRCDALYTSGFLDDVMFAHNGHE